MLHPLFRPPKRRLVYAGLTVAALVASGAVVGLSPASAAPATTGGAGLDGNVFISEVFTHGAGTDDNVLADGDWIELHNASTTTDENIGGAVLSDSEDSHELIIPDDTTIPAGGYMAFRTDSSDNTGAANFSLGDVDEARLFVDDAAFQADTQAVPTSVDEFDWGHSPIHSWAKDFGAPGTTPATAPWEATFGETLNGANNFTPPSQDLSDVRINEVNTNGSANDTLTTPVGDWVELFNTSGTPVDLGGAVLSDSDPTHAYIIDPNTMLPANGFLTVGIADPSHLGSFGLGDTDSVELYSDATTTDLFNEPMDPAAMTPSATAPTAADAASWANTMVNTLVRVNASGDPVNGGTAFTSAAMVPTTAYGPSTGPTEGASNTTAPARMDPIPGLSDVRLNEVKTTADSTNGDWIELINTATAVPGDDGTRDISNAILSDNDDGDALRIPADTVLQPSGTAGDIMAFRVDDPMITGHFGLGDSDSARLFNADAINLGTGTNSSTPIDSFSWTQHAPSSYGRHIGENDPNNNSDWAETGIATFNGPNNFDTSVLVADPALNPDQSAALAPDFGFIQLNEIESDEPDGEMPANDYVELTNTASAAIDVAGGILSDNSTAKKTGLLNDAIVMTSGDDGNVLQKNPDGTFSPNSVIQPGGFAIVEVDNGDVDGNFGLGSNDSAELFNPPPATVDLNNSTEVLAYINSVLPIDHDSWADHAAGSLQRQNAGLGNWSDCSPVTPGASNTVCTTVPK